MAGPVITLSAFAGEQPKISPRLLPENAATEAFDCRLDDGALTPIRESIYVATVSGTALKTIYRWGDVWLAWDSVVHAVPGPVAADRLYYTGDAKPRMRVSGDVYALEHPGPSSKLSTSKSGTGSGDTITRIYTYTFVTEFGEESAPAPASNRVQWQDGETVTLSGFSDGNATRGVTKQRIYRSQSGQVGTYFYLLAERDTSTSDFVDDFDVDDFQEQLPSQDWTPPPDGLEWLTALPNGMMAAFVGKQLYFCEPYYPHAWPEKYVLTTNNDIVGLVALGTSLVILTTGQPYIAQGTHPAQMVMEKLEWNAPCINERSIVDLGYAAAYASNEGLISISADGQVNLVTAQLFNRDGWLAFSPSTIVASQIGGRYVAFYETTDYQGNIVAGSLFIDLGGSPYLLRSATRADAAWFDAGNGGLYFVRNDTKRVFRFDAPTGSRRRMYWKSKPFILPYEENFGAIRIDTDDARSGQDITAITAFLEETYAANLILIGDLDVGGGWNDNELNALSINGSNLISIPDEYLDENYLAEAGGGTVKVTVYAGGDVIASISTRDKIVRLPAGFRARKWEIDVSGTRQVTQIIMAKTIDDLKVNG